MEEGSLRWTTNCERAVRGTQQFAQGRSKNLIRSAILQKALEYEIGAAHHVIESGGRISQETRLWNQSDEPHRFNGSKEKAHDYPLFPEPDLCQST